MEGDPVNREGRSIDPERVRRLSEASEWLLRLQSPDRTEAEYEEWLQWCDAHPENFAAFETVRRKWNDLDALKALPLEPARRARRWSVPRWAIAASLILVFGAGAIVWHVSRDAAPAADAISTGYANRTATLPDGSTMILGAQSLVNMDFNRDSRRIDLSSGEAYFSVRHDAERPFIVQAGAVSVTAIGTAFDVRRNQEKVTVTVEEGTVEVRGATQNDEEAVWRAEAGYQLVYSVVNRTASLASVDPATALSWRHGEFAYIHEPLSSVVEDLNRYSARKIRIADPQIGEIPFTGTAFAPSLDGWLAAVEAAYPIDVRESPAGEIILSARK
ncbi:MAG TPA: FecR domain-containing protein [Steroidobacteraceae bacterium]